MKTQIKKYLGKALRLVVYGKKGEVVRRYSSGTLRRFLSIIYARLKVGCSVYIRVGYGKGKTNQGTMEEFCNEGKYTDPKEAEKALHAFLD